MKKLLIIFCLLLGLTSISALANVAQDLQNRLAKLNSFYAHFSQTIASNEGTMLQQGSGEFWINRPNKFHWRMLSPDESVLITDGQTLWFYNPVVNQVIVTWLKNAVNKIPLMLMTSSNENDLEQYQVKQNGDNFEMMPKSSLGNLKKFVININNIGIIRSFSIVEKDGQRSTFIVQNQKEISADLTKFAFNLPQNVTIDDQRQ